jgi:excisionase family DNA binding protein
VNTPIAEQDDIRWFSYDEAAQYLHTTVLYLRKLVCYGKLPSYSPNGGHVLFLKSDLDAYIMRSRRAATWELQENAAAILSKNAEGQKNRRGRKAGRFCNDK